MSRAGALLLRGMRWRLTGSVLIVLTAAIAMGTAILGPLYLQAGGDSLVRRAVATAAESQTGFSLVAQNGHAVSAAQITREQTTLIRRAHLAGRFAPPLTSVSTGIHLTSATSAQYADQLTSRTGICSVLHFSSGGCDLGPGDTVISTRSARDLRVSTGATITVTTPAGAHPLRLRITGLFRVPNLNASYWFGDGASFFQFGTPTGKPPLPQLDDLFVSPASAQALPAPYLPATTLQTPLRPGAVGLGDARQTRRAMTTLESIAGRDGFSATTALPAILAAALHQRGLMGTIVAVAAVQLVLLAIWVLAAVLLRSADLRRSELRVAQLRGFPFASILAVTVAEPAILCAVGAVLGVVGAWVAVEIASGVLFAAGTTISLDIWVFVGFAAAILTIGGVLGLSAIRLIRGSGLERATPATGESSRSRLVTDVAILVLSAVALLAAATSGALASHSDPIAAAAPAVLALGVSVIAVRVIEFACLRVTSATVDTSWVASFLAVRQIGRRPAALRESRTLVIALCLACFAVSAWSVSRTNRSTAATFSLGAPTVVTVTSHATGLQQAVDHVDPTGRFAIAVVQISTSGQDLLAVDTSRLTHVISWPSGTARASLAKVVRTLQPRTAPQVNVAGGTVSVFSTVRASGGLASRLAHLDLSLWVFNQQLGTSIVSLGALRAGAGAYHASLSSVCPGGCRLAGLGVLSSSGHVPGSGEVTLDVSGVVSVRPGTGTVAHVSADLSAPDWRSATAGVEVQPLAQAVGFVIPASVVAGDAGASGSVTPPMASVADYPYVIPEVAGSVAAETAQAASQGAGTLPDAGLDGNPVTVRPDIAAAALPRVGARGEIADLDLLEREQINPLSSGDTEEVWLGSAAPSDAIARLRAAGLRVTGVQRASTLVRAGRHTGPALAYDFMLLATLVALLTVAISTFGVLAAGTRQRATELTGLEVAGVPRATLVRSLTTEAIILSSTALFGAAAGVAGAALAIPSLPQLGAATTAPLSYDLPVGLILAVAACGVLVVILATALAARGILSRMSPSLLRAGVYDSD